MFDNDFMIKTIASGSDGNCYIVKGGNTTVLIECGVRMGEIKKHVKNVQDIDGILLTHEHSDHALSVENFLRYRKNVFMSAGTCMALGVGGYHRAKVVGENTLFRIKDFSIKAFGTAHDAMEPFGFLLKYKDKKLLFMTDTCYSKVSFSGLTHIMIECNYSHPLLLKSMVDEVIDAKLKDRILSSHFELEAVIDFLHSMSLERVEEIHLLHISKRNGDAEMFKRRVQEATGKPVFAKVNGKIT